MPEDGPRTVAILGAHSNWQKLLAEILKSQGRLACRFAGPDQLISWLEIHGPDCPLILAEAGIEEHSQEWIETIVARFPRIKLILVSTEEDPVLGEEPGLAGQVLVVPFRPSEILKHVDGIWAGSDQE